MEAQQIGQIIPAAQNLVQVMPEQKPLKSGDEQKLAVALNSKFIRDSTFEEIKQVLRLAMMKVGIRANNMPNDIEKLVLFEHITENYGGNRLDEIRVAFDMAIAGKLGLAADDVKAYENFSCLYFSAIMNAYRVWAAETYKQIKIEKPMEQKIFGQDDLDNYAREAVQAQYRAFIRGHEIFNQEANKEILAKDGLLNASESVLEFYNRMAAKQKTDIYVWITPNTI